MIRINLLPYHEIERKETQTRKIFILAGSFVLFLLCLASLQVYFWNNIASLKQEIRSKEDRLVVLKKSIGEVEQYKREKQILEKKLAVIGELERNRSYPVRMLADVASQVPVKDIWLDKLAQAGTSLQIEGKARDNFAVVRFMKNLEGSLYVQSVDLISSKQTEVSGVKLQQFNLSCVLRRGV